MVGPSPGAERVKTRPDGVLNHLPPSRHSDTLGPITASTLRERLYRRARADQVAVGVGAVNAAHRRPHLGPESLAERVGRLLAGVGMIPVGDQQAFRGMRRAAQRVVIDGPRAGA